MAKKAKATGFSNIRVHRAQTSGQPGTSRYITVKNKKNNPERLELKNTTLS